MRSSKHLGQALALYRREADGAELKLTVGGQIKLKSAGELKFTTIREFATESEARHMASSQGFQKYTY